MLCTGSQETQRKRERIMKRSKSISATACKVHATLCLQKPFSMQTILGIGIIFQAPLIIWSFNHSFVCFLSRAKNMSMRLDVSNKSKAYHALGLLCVALLMQKSGAREFQVGGKGNWGVPTDNTSLNYNQWAERNRFQIGDSILFNYASGQDSVLQVDKDAYTNCNTDNPIARYTDGHTVVTFSQSGPHYFISGNKDYCLKNEKLVVVVMADRSNRNSSTTTEASPSPPPSPSSDVVPSPAPAGEYSPPEGTVEPNPTPAPEPNNKPNSASSIFVSLVSSIGAVAASSLLAF